MKRKQKKKSLAISLVCGAVCAVCVVLFMQSVRGEAEAARSEALARYGGEQLEVCVATRDIAAGEPIQADDVDTRLWIADLLPAQAARTLDEIEGRAPTTPIMEGEVVVLKRFEGQAAALDVPDGLAALSVPAQDVQAVGGSLTAGTTADLYASGGTSTALLAEDVLVLATSSTGSEGASADLSWVTVAVAPESVQEVIDSSRKTELHFVLSGAAAQTPAAEGEGESANTEEPLAEDAAFQSEEGSPANPGAAAQTDAAVPSDTDGKEQR